MTGVVSYTPALLLLIFYFQQLTRFIASLIFSYSGEALGERRSREHV